MSGRPRPAAATLALALNLALPLGAAAIVPPATAADPAPATTIARIGGREVPLADVQAYVQALPAETRQQLAADPPALSRVVRAYVARSLLLDEAKAAGWEKRPEVAAALARARDEALLASYLRARTEPPAEFPTEAEVAAAYEANKARLLVPRQYRLAQIIVPVPAGADKAAEEKARKRLDDILARLKQKDADFDALARQVAADDGTPGRGGDLGWIGEPMLAASIQAAVAGLEKGGVSPPVRLADGWHVLKLLDTRPAAVPPLADVRTSLVAALRAQRQADAEQAYLARLIEKNPPAVNELALPQVLQPPLQPTQQPSPPARTN
jgi:peptidylprolyl isomerase